MVIVFLELGQNLKTQISNKDKIMKSSPLFPLKIVYTLHTYRNSIPEAQDTLHQVSEWQHSHPSNTSFTLFSYKVKASRQQDTLNCNSPFILSIRPWSPHLMPLIVICLKRMVSSTCTPVRTSMACVLKLWLHLRG